MVKDKTIKLFHRRKRNATSAQVPEPEPYEFALVETELHYKTWWRRDLRSCFGTYLAASLEVGTA
jgi:hypothetical protein